MKKILAVVLMTMALMAMPLSVLAADSPSTTPSIDPHTPETSAKTGDEVGVIFGAGAAALAGVAFVASKKRKEA